jgi:hypothetical protein
MHVARLRRIVTGTSPLLAAATLLAVVSALAAALAVALGSPAPAAGALAHPAAESTPKSKASELWATVDVCNTPHHPDTIGIRGSMPGDGHRHDVMYMRFLVQSLDVTTHTWADIGRSADSGFVQVGSGALTRQAGRSFEFKPTATTYTLRGFVEFQWHRAGRTIRVTSLPTSGGHTSLAGAEPAGFSAAACALP